MGIPGLLLSDYTTKSFMHAAITDTIYLPGPRYLWSVLANSDNRRQGYILSRAGNGQGLHNTILSRYVGADMI